MTNSFLSPTTMKALTNEVGREIGGTAAAVTESTRQHVQSHYRHDSEHVKYAIIHGERTAKRLMPPILKIFRRDVFAFTDIDFVSRSGKNAHIMLSECYIWSSFCILAYFLGGVFGVSSPMTEIVAPILHSINAFVLAMILLPMYGYLCSRKVWYAEYKQRTFVFRMSLVIGALLSYVSGNMHNWSPPVFLVPMWIGLLTCWRGFGQSLILAPRWSYVTIAIGTPLLTYSVLAYFVYKSFSFFYTVKWILVCFVAFVDLQLKLGRVKRGWSSHNLEQFSTVHVYLMIQFVFSTKVPQHFSL